MLQQNQKKKRKEKVINNMKSNRRGVALVNLVHTNPKAFRSNEWLTRGRGRHEYINISVTTALMYPSVAFKLNLIKKKFSRRCDEKWNLLFQFKCMAAIS